MSALAAWRLGRAGIVVVTVVVAIVINLLVHALGSAAGATYTFTSASGPAHVDAVTIAGFTAVPLLIGMTAAAMLSRRWRWAIPVALVVAPVAAIGSVPFMPLAADFDTASTVALAAAHVALGAVAVAGVLAVRALAPAPAGQVVTR